MSSLRRPQLCRAPVFTDVNAPAGGEDWPRESSPQHRSVPSARTPQVCCLPALTDLNTAGGRPAVGSPQQTTEPERLRPQVWKRRRGPT